MTRRVGTAVLGSLYLGSGGTSIARTASGPSLRIVEKPTRAERGVQAYVLGMHVSTVTEHGLLERVGEAVSSRRPTVFVGLYASLYRAMSGDRHYADLVSRSVTYPDGQGVVSELHRRGVTEAERLATTDVVLPIAELAARRGWRVGLYGAAPGVADRAAAHLRETAPGVQIAGTPAAVPVTSAALRS